MYAVDEHPATKADDLDMLVEMARAGDVDAFTDIVRTLQGRVRAFTRRLAGATQVGDDAAQETFLRVWRAIGRYRADGSFTAWVFTVARNTSIELLRKENRQPLPLDELPETPGVGSDLELRALVTQAVRDLPEPYRTTFLYREAGLSYEEVADAVSCAVGTVRSRLHTARRMLADRLAPHLFGGDADAR